MRYRASYIADNKDCDDDFDNVGVHCTHAIRDKQCLISDQLHSYTNILVVDHDDHDGDDNQLSLN